MNAAEILERAADVVERNGWIQGVFYVPVAIDGTIGGLSIGLEPKDVSDCPVCAGGGINVAADHAPDVDVAEGDLLEAVEAFASHVDPDFRTELEAFWANPDPDYEPDIYEAIGNWNDAVGRTEDEVIAALRECAAAVRSVS